MSTPESPKEDTLHVYDGPHLTNAKCLLEAGSLGAAAGWIEYDLGNDNPKFSLGTIDPDSLKMVGDSIGFRLLSKNKEPAPRTKHTKCGVIAAVPVAEDSKYAYRWHSRSASGKTDIEAWIDPQRDCLCVKLRHWGELEGLEVVPEGATYPEVTGEQLAQIIEDALLKQEG